MVSGEADFATTVVSPLLGLGAVMVRLARTVVCFDTVLRGRRVADVHVLFDTQARDCC